MATDGGCIQIQGGDPSWFTSEVESLQGQMSLLQSALESSKQAVEEFHRRAAANVAATERKYRDLFNNVPTGIYRMSPDGYLSMANPAMIRMLGYESLEELAVQRQAPPWKRLTAGQPNRLIGIERSWTKRNGERITVRESSRAVSGADGEVVYYEGVVEDITGQRKAQILERDCRTFLELVARNESVDRVSQHLVRLLERQLTGASVMLLLNRQGYIYPIAGGPPVDNTQNRRCRVAEDGCFLGRAAHRKQVFVIEDIDSEPAADRNHPLFDGTGVRSCWTMPVCSGDGEVSGLIAVYRTVAHSPGFSELEIVETACRLATVAIEHQNLQHDLARQAMLDRLTGLPNRMYFEDRLVEAIARSAATVGNLALLWIDLDRFKEINDTLGHQVGDDLIRQVAARLQPTVQGLLARTGGDEFAVIIETPESAEEALAHARDLLECLRSPFVVKGCELFVTASIGVAMYPEHGRTATELEQNADAAMYRVKSRSRNGAGLYENSLGDQIRDRMDLGNALRRALEHRELDVYFQPQVSIGGHLRGLEALLRWRHPTRGLLQPGNFIDIAEETGLIVPIGAWVIEEACRKGAAWNRNREEPLVVAVNVSALQFYFSDLFDVVQRALAESGLPPSCLELELTESLLMRDAKQSAQELDKLRALGVTIAIDDFGTGYSSLAYLRRLPVDLLKIDRSFLEHIDSHSASAMLQAITALAHALGLRVVAEGVEEEEQLRAIRGIGVDLAQGYLIGRPAPAHVADGLVRSSLGCLSRTA